ncbi:unnamed protein product [Ectocarpus sp. 8 AP-2014]
MDLYLHDIRDNSASFQNPTMQLFAMEEDGTNVFVSVKNFKTYLYVGFDFDISQDDVRSNYLQKFKQEKWERNVYKMSVVMRKRLVGFSDGDLFPFILMEFTGTISFYVVRKHLDELCGERDPGPNTFVDRNKYPGMCVYESKSVDSILKFFHASGVRPSSYFRMENYTQVADNAKQTHCAKEFVVDFADVRPVGEDVVDRKPPPMVVCSYDLETSGLNTNEDYIFQASMIFARLGDPCHNSEGSGAGHAVDSYTDGVVICVGDTESVDGTPLLVVENELELLDKFREILIERGCNILCGYNTFKFDSAFLYKRAERYGFDGFKKLSFIKELGCDLQVKTLQSAALGKNELKQIVIPGRVEIDLYMVMRRSQKLSSYKLNAVCDKFFGGKKDDVTYKDILEACTSKDPRKLGVIAKYCYQDSGLVLKLLDKIKEVYDATEMAKLCTVPLTYIVGRGQQIKCMSLILNRIHGEFVCNYTPVKKKTTADGKQVLNEGYKGASVIDAKKGFYEKDPVVTMDFASLYPSIMRLKQLCYTTIVKDEKYRGIEGVVYEDHEISDGVSVTFAHRPGSRSILCELEEMLGEERKATKKLMKSEKDPFAYSLLDSKQKAQKVTMNSIYGFTGTVNNGMLPLVEIAAAVTSTGRDMIKRTKEYAEKEHGCNVIYGDTDSVMVIFPEHRKIDNLADKMRYCFDMGTKVSKEISEMFGHPILLEFENIYFKYLLVSKKRYAGLSWETVEGPPTMTMKGLVTVRRDNAPFVGKCASETIHMLMDVGVADGRGAVKKHLAETLLRLERGQVSIEDLTIRKELKQWVYKTPTPHATLAMKILQRTKEQAVFREFIKPAYEMAGGYDDSLLSSVWTRMTNLKSFLSTRTKREISMSDMVESIRGDATSPFKAEAYAVVALRRLYDDVYSVLVGDSFARVVGLVMAGISDAQKLGERYMAFVRYNVVDWDPPTLGERIPYVVTTGKGDISSRAEDPRMVNVGRCRPDFLYYVDHQLRNPMVDLLQHVVDSPSSLFAESQRRMSNLNHGRREITSFFKKRKVAEG